MPKSYRAAIISIGVFLALGGTVGLVGGITAPGTAPQHLSSFLGSGFAIICGLVVVRSTVAGRAPRWVARMFGVKPDEAKAIGVVTTRRSFPPGAITAL